MKIVDSIVGFALAIKKKTSAINYEYILSGVDLQLHRRPTRTLSVFKRREKEGEGEISGRLPTQMKSYGSCCVAVVGSDF